MPLVIDDKGSANNLFLPADPENLLRGKVMLRGNSNAIDVATGSVAANVLISAGSSNIIRIGSSCRLGILIIHTSEHCRVLIGGGVGFNGRVRLMAHEPSEIRIGDDCLFAGNVDVTASDMHSILDAETGQRVNPAKDVVIEDRVWVGQGALILKGTRIGSDSIIGAASVVTKDVPPGCVVAGNPARVVRTGVRWIRQLL